MNLSKYSLTNLSLSSRFGRSNFTISSILFFMAVSNCSGRLLAKTSMNLEINQKQCLIILSNVTHTRFQSDNKTLLVRLFASVIQESIQCCPHVFTNSFLCARWLSLTLLTLIFLAIENKRYISHHVSLSQKSICFINKQ